MTDSFVIGQQTSDSSSSENDEEEDVNLERTSVERLSQHLGLDILPNQFAKIPEKDTEISSDSAQVGGHMEMFFYAELHLKTSDIIMLDILHHMFFFDK